MWRPQPCRWFELVASRNELTPVLEALAHTGAIELQTHEGRAAPLVIESAERQLDAFRALARSHRPYWPPADAAPRAAALHISDPALTLVNRLAQLEAWRVEADPLIAELERLVTEANRQADLAEFLAAWGAEAVARGGSLLPEPGLFATAGRFLVDVRLLVVPRAARASDWPADALQIVIRGAAHDFVVLVGRRDALAQLDQTMLARHVRRIEWPGDLFGSLAEVVAEVEARGAALARRRAERARTLQDLWARHDLAAVLADIDLIQWLLQHGGKLAASERLVWVTGWTTAGDEDDFCAPLTRAGLRCVVQFSAPPAGTEAPSLLINPSWARRFEGFARLLGQPGRDEADPSPLVALVAPLLFGFMFGDVGQGAVLCLAGWLLRRRVPMLVLLIPGGLAAMVFGLLFGSVFAREDLLPALWLHPLQEPVTLLAVTVGFGAILLLAGLALNAAQAVWRRETRAWWGREAGLVLAYGGLLAASVLPQALWALPLGALWSALGSSWIAGASHRLSGLAAGLGRFIEQLLQLLVNTISFARVGAFGLAHAGLSAAVVGVAEASGTIGYGVVLVLGNVLILLLEGLVVGIQTTRLLLFEFFVRFLKGSGRSFRPLPPPRLQPATPTGNLT